MRARSNKPLCFSLICGCMLAQLGCVDPFAGQATTPDKIRNETAAGEKTNKGRGEPGAGQGADGAAQPKGDKAKKKEEKPEQTYREAWQLICDAEKYTGTSSNASRADRGAAVASWIVDNVTNQKARYWFIDFGKAKSQHKEALFRAEVEQVGIEPCMLLGLLFPDASPTSGPAGDAGPSDGRAR